MTKAKTDTELLTEISRKLDSVLGFLAASAVEKDQGAVVKRLRDSGHPTDVIARVVGISENAVAIRLTRLKQKQGKDGAKSDNKSKVTTGDKQRTEESAPS